MKSFALSLTLLAALLMWGCNAQPREDCKRYAEVLRQDAARPDEQLTPDRAREIARDAADAFEVLRWELGGPRPGPEVLARVGITQ